MSTPTPFTLTGFTEDVGFRVFAFERVAEDRTRIRFTVRTDLALSRRYGIRLQELPLLCRGLLERREDAGLERALIFTEEEMCNHEKDCVAAKESAALKRKPRKSAGEHADSALEDPVSH